MANVNLSFMQSTQAWVAGFFGQMGNFLGALQVKLVNLMQKLELTPDNIIETCSYLGVGFFIGFVIKKYLKMFLGFVFLFLVTIWALDGFNLIMINWNHFQSLMHIAPNDTVGSLMHAITCWGKQNLRMVVGGLIGILLGYKIG